MTKELSSDQSREIKLDQDLSDLVEGLHSHRLRKKAPKIKEAKTPQPPKTKKRRNSLEI